ncbi:UTR3 [Scenedesmus sp. PABB004]|nr:UTR3 [Scenedesmus sp. PABB004]
MAELEVLVSDGSGQWQPVRLAASAEEPLPCALDAFTEWVAARVIGPTGGRSKVVAEVTSDVPLAPPPPGRRPPAGPGGAGGGAPRSGEVLVQQRVEVTELALLAAPSDCGAPSCKASCRAAVARGVNLHALLLGAEAGAERPLDSQAQLDGLIAATVATQQQMRRAALRRLSEKLLNEVECKRLHVALMAEGAAGVWELLSDAAARGEGLTGAALRGVMAALCKPLLSRELQLPAVCAAWHACTLAKPRERLTQARAPGLGVVEALLRIAESCFDRLRRGGSACGAAARPPIASGAGSGSACGPADCRAMLVASLGALGVLAVDADARRRVLGSRTGVRLLADVAAAPPSSLRSAEEAPAQGPADGSLKEEVAVAVPASEPVHPTASEATPPTREPTLELLDAGEEAADSPLAAGGSECFGLTLGPDEEEGPVLPPLLVELQPAQLAAEVLAAVLLRDADGRAAFLAAGRCRLLLPLLAAADPRTQLCGAAVLTRMAGARRGSGSDGGWASTERGSGELMAQQEPQLLRELHASLMRLLGAALLGGERPAGAGEQPALPAAAAQAEQAAAAAGAEAAGASALRGMLLDYGSLALWTITSALAPHLSEREVLAHLSELGRLASACLEGADGTRAMLAECAAGALCSVAATGAAAAAVAVLGPDGASELVDSLRPLLGALLRMDVPGERGARSQCLAAATVMLLASYERPRGETLSELEPETESQLAAAVNPHPPFRGVLRDNLLGAGLLQALLDSAVRAEHRPRDKEEGGDGLRQLHAEVIAAACQALAAVNRPLPPPSCALLLDYLAQHVGQQLPAQAAAPCATGHARGASHAGGATEDGGSSCSAAAAVRVAPQHAAATFWCLAQHECGQRQLLIDGRWAGMLDALARPALQRVRRAAAADSRGGSACGADGAPASAVPRLHLEGLLGGAPASGAPASGATAGWGSGCSGAGAGPRAAAALGVLHLCLTTAWLLLQQRAQLRAAAEELPPGTRAVHAAGASSWWAAELSPPGPVALTEADELGLALLASVASLPDAAHCYSLKALALNACWNLAAADEAMHGALVGLRVPESASAVCRAATAATGDGEPAGARLPLLGHALAALAWLSAQREAAAACCAPGVVGALLAVLRMEQRAFRELQALAAEQHRAWQQQQQRAAPASATPAASRPPVQPQPPPPVAAAPEPAAVPVPPLPGAVLQAPCTALQRPGEWLPAWHAQLAAEAAAAAAATARLARSGSASACSGSSLSASGRPSSAGRLAGCRSAGRTEGDGGSTCGALQCGEPPGGPPAATPDGREGMLALWALLGVTAHHAGQVAVCRRGLYTLVRLVQGCPEPQRRSVAAAVLANVAAAGENVAALYRAELRLKHAALLHAAGLKRVRRERHAAPGRARDEASGPGAGGGAERGCAGGRGSVPASAGATPPHTTWLQAAADTAVLAANMASTRGGAAARGLTSDDRRAGELIARVSALTARPVVPVHRPDRASPGLLAARYAGQRPAASAQPTAAAAAAAAQRCSFSDGVGALLAAAAGGPARTAQLELAGGRPVVGAGAGAASVPAAGDVRAAFVAWLDECVGEAVADSAPAISTPHVAEAALRDATQTAELDALTTEDAEEAEWLAAQREAQRLHDFHAARAAQGEVLRGSLPAALRGSASSLWHEDRWRASSPKGGSRAAPAAAWRPGGSPRRHGGGRLVRPASAPPGGRISGGGSSGGGSPLPGASCAWSRVADPWAPAVVAFRQLAVNASDVAPGPARELLVAGPEQAVAHQLGAAAAAVRAGRLPPGSPAATLAASEHRRAALRQELAALHVPSAAELAEAAAAEAEEQRECEARAATLQRHLEQGAAADALLSQGDGGGGATDAPSAPQLGDEAPAEPTPGEEPRPGSADQQCDGARSSQRAGAATAAEGAEAAPHPAESPLVLERPQTGCDRPCFGTSAVAGAPLPLTVLAAAPEVAARPLEVRAAAASPRRAPARAHPVRAAPLQLLATVAPDAAAPPTAFRFHAAPAPAPRRCMHAWPHVPGAQFCGSLGHYLLPSGRLAHLWLGGPADRGAGHVVSLPRPPATPWPAAAWLPDGLPPPAAAAEVLLGAAAPQAAPELDYVPTPHLAPDPTALTLAAERGAGGGLALRAPPARLRAVVTVRVEAREFRRPAPPRPGAWRRSTAGAAVGAGAATRARAATAAAPPPTAPRRRRPSARMTDAGPGGGLGRGLLLLACVAGIYAAYLTQGLVSEHLQMKAYAPDGARFQHLEALNGAQSAVCFLWAYAILAAGRARRRWRGDAAAAGGDAGLPPWTAYWRPALTNSIGPACGLIALRSISYPAQVLAKSCKMVPVMLVGSLLHGKRYSALEYVCMTCIGLGVSLFARKSSSKVTARLAAPNAPLGYLLCFVNLLLDGYTNAFQDEINRRHPANDPIHMMAWMNFWCAAFYGAYLSASGVGASLAAFVAAHPAARGDVALFCLCGAVGQLFIFLTIKRFGALVNTLVCTTRKFFNILGSVLLNGNPLLPAQWAAVGLVFTGLITSSLAKSGAHRHAAAKKAA